MTTVNELQTFRYLINPHGGFPQKTARFFHFPLHDEISGGDIIKFFPVTEKGSCGKIMFPDDRRNINLFINIRRKIRGDLPDCRAFRRLGIFPVFKQGQIQEIHGKQVDTVRHAGKMGLCQQTQKTGGFLRDFIRHNKFPAGVLGVRPETFQCIE